jgi:hypothetical protein
MDQILDSKGWPVVPGARIRVRFPFRAKSDAGEVIRVIPEGPEAIIEYRRFKTHGVCHAKPAWCTVQRGKTKAQIRYERERDAMRGKPRRGNK